MSWPVARRHVFLVSRSSQPCGVEAFAKLLCEATNRAAGQSSRLTLSGQRGDLATLWRSLGPDSAVICNLPLVAWKRLLLTPLLAFLIATLRGAERIVVLHEWSDLNWQRRGFYLLYCLFASSIYLSSPHIRQQFEEDEWAAWLRRRVRGILPIPPNVRRPQETVEGPLTGQLRQWRAEGRYVLAAFGSIYPKKQTSRLLDVAAELKRRGQRPVLVLIGSFVRGPEPVEEPFWRKVRDLGLDGDVVVSGYIATDEEIFGLFAEVDAFAYMFAEGLTSRRGSVLACMQSGRPVVVNAPVGADEFAHHRAYSSLLEARNLRLVGTDAAASDYADALIAARRQPAARVVVDFDACWDDAARALMGRETGLVPATSPAPVPVARA